MPYHGVHSLYAQVLSVLRLLLYLLRLIFKINIYFNLNIIPNKYYKLGK